MNRFAAVTLSAGLALPALTSCTTVKVESWTDPAAVGRPMGKTLVVGISERESVRREYEEQFVAGLAEAGVEALPSARFVPSTAGMSEEQFTALLQEQGIDTVILTRVVGREERIRYTPPVEYPLPYRRPYGYYSHGYRVVASPGYVSDYTEIHLETNVYDVPSAALVWSGQKAVSDEQSTAKNIRAVIKAVVADLARQGLLDPAADRPG